MSERYITVIFDKKGTISKELSNIISYRPQQKIFIAEIKDRIILTNLNYIEVRKYITDNSKLCYVFVIESGHLETFPAKLDYILEKIYQVGYLAPLLILSNSKKAKILFDYLSLIYRSLGVKFPVKFLAFKDSEKAIVHLRKIIFADKPRKIYKTPIHSQLQDYYYLRREAIATFKKICMRNPLIRLLLTKYWYRYLGLFTSRKPRLLVFLALVISFYITDLLLKNYLNAPIHALLSLISIGIIKYYGIEALKSMIRWFFYLFVVTPILSEFYFNLKFILPHLTKSPSEDSSNLEK